MCLSNGTTPQPIAPENCSSPQKTRQVFESAMKKNIWFWVSGFFVSGVTSEVGF